MTGSIDCEVCQKFLIDHVKLQEFCFKIEIKIHREYAYDRLNGNNNTERSISVVHLAIRRGELNELVYNIYYYAKEKEIKVELLREKKIIEQLKIARLYFKDKNDINKAKELEYELKSLSKIKTSSPEVPPNHPPWPGEILLLISIALVVFLIILSFVDTDPYTTSLERAYYKHFLFIIAILLSCRFFLDLFPEINTMPHDVTKLLLKITDNLRKK